jgi:hypothetical protein
MGRLQSQRVPRTRPPPAPRAQTMVTHTNACRLGFRLAVSMARVLRPGADPVAQAAPGRRAAVTSTGIAPTHLRRSMAVRRAKATLLLSAARTPAGVSDLEGDLAGHGISAPTFCGSDRKSLALARRDRLVAPRLEASLARSCSNGGTCVMDSAMSAAGMLACSPFLGPRMVATESHGPACAKMAEIFSQGTGTARSYYVRFPRAVRDR